MRPLLIVVLAFSCAFPAKAQFAEFNDDGVTFGHVHLVVADIELHKKLWPELFDADLVEKQGYSAVRISNALIFFRDAEPSAPSVETAVDHFGLEVRNIESVLSKWRALGYEVDSQSTDSSERASAFITMPGGTRLALHESPDQAGSTSMGHIHFVTPMRDELMQWYSEKFGAAGSAPADSDQSLAIPGSRLSFERSETDRLPTDGTTIDHIGFEIREWDKFIAMLEDNDIEFEFGPTYVESLDLWVAFFNDPGGVVVEITHGLDRY